MDKSKTSGGLSVRRSPQTIASDHRLVLALWYSVGYLLIVYASIRWGRPSGRRYPGSD